MQVGKSNNNRFRKLIPNNNRNITPTTAQIYSAQFKPYSQSKIDTIYSNSHKTNYHSLQRQSGDDLKSVRERQKVERRLRTISAAAFEGEQQSHEYNDNKLKRGRDKFIQDRIQSGKKSKLTQLMDLILQFKFKTDSILKYQEQIIQNQNQPKEQSKVDQTVFEEQICQLITKTRQSSTNLMAIYINRLIRQIKEDVFNELAEYEEQVSYIQCNEQIKQQTESYLVSDILIKKDQVKDRRNTRERSNLMNVNKFFEKQ